MSISKRLRYEVLRRDNFTCRYCGAAAPEVALEVDHIVPVALGGRDDPTNLATACADCNGGKSSVPPNAEQVADANAINLQWAQAMRDAARQMEAEADLWDADVDAFDTEWSRWKYNDGTSPARPADWRQRIRHMRRSGLPTRTMLELVETAMSHHQVKDEWAYFVGCCMRRVDAIQEQASRNMRRGS